MLVNLLLTYIVESFTMGCGGVKSCLALMHVDVPMSQLLLPGAGIGAAAYLLQSCHALALHSVSGHVALVFRVASVLKVFCDIFMKFQQFHFLNASALRVG